jgi:hypothetical protein
VAVSANLAMDVVVDRFKAVGQRVFAGAVIAEAIPVPDATQKCNAVLSGLAMGSIQNTVQDTKAPFQQEEKS